MASELVRAEVIDAEEFPALSQRHSIGPVPNTLINYGPGYVGAAPESYAVEKVLATP